MADISHRNLVTLYELVSDAEEWFFTMEYLEGVDFCQHVQPWGATAPARRRDAGR